MNESIERYRKMLETDPRNTEALNGIARALAGQDKPEVAHDYYRLVLAIDLRNTEAMNGIAVMYRQNRDSWSAALGFCGAGIDRESWSIASAMEWFRKTLAVDVENQTALRGLAELEEARSQLEMRIWSQEYDLVP